MAGHDEDGVEVLRANALVGLELSRDQPAGHEGGGVSAPEQIVTDIYESLWKSVYRYVLGILRDPAEAEDVGQEVFARLFQQLQQRKSVRNVRAWIFRVAHNLAVEQLGQRAFSGDLGYAGAAQACEQARDPAPNAVERALVEERHRRLRLALARLSQQERHCLELRAEGLRYREIAEVLGIRIPTVQAFLARAVTKLKGVCE